jgi:hypothetical protein
VTEPQRLDGRVVLLTAPQRRSLAVDALRGLDQALVEVQPVRRSAYAAVIELRLYRSRLAPVHREIGMTDAHSRTMERIMSWLARHPGVVRGAWLAALLVLAACNNPTDGGDPGGY